MYLIICIFLIQSQPQSHGISLGHAPATVTEQAARPQVPRAPQIARSKLNTTPDLDPDTELTHAQMEKDIGGQEQALADLRAEVHGLQALRTDPDRKDIDSLKDTKTYVTITASVLATVAVFLFGFKEVIWTDILKPRLKRELSLPSSPQESKET